MVLNSKWAVNPLTLDESLNDVAWADSNVQKMPVAGNIWLYLRNDAHNMYFAIDLPDEMSNSTANDYFWMSFDVNKNGSINPNLDINYGAPVPQYPGKLTRQYYLAPSQWTGINGTPGIYKFAFEGSPKNAAAHKVWKLKVPLADFGINLAAMNIIAWMGLRINVSGHTSEFPALFSGTGFGQMSTSVLVFARNAVIDPALMGPVMAAVGLIPTANSIISPATGRATTAAGYYVAANRAAFGGNLNIIFNHNTINTLRNAGVNKYKVMFGLVGGIQSALQGAWLNYRWVGNDVVLDSFGADGGGFYTLPNPAAQYSIQDLLIQFNSGLLPNGLYQFTVQFFNNANVLVPSPAQTLVLYIDNTVPVVAINNISRSTMPGVDVMQQHTCDPLTLGHTEGLLFNITASDSDGDIDAISMSWGAGDGGGGSFYSDSFGPTKPTVWTGITNVVVPLGGAPWVPAKSCIYSFTLTATSRTTNGYGPIGYNQITKMLYIVKS
ncbi:MAG: hypothetical protein ABI378_03970 [Chitinophagaceae bacterium]